MATEQQMAGALTKGSAAAFAYLKLVMDTAQCSTSHDERLAERLKEFKVEQRLQRYGPVRRARQMRLPPADERQAKREPAEDGAGSSSPRQPAPAAKQEQAEDSVPPVPEEAGGEASPAVDSPAKDEAAMVQGSPNPGTTGQVTHATDGASS